MPKSRPVVKPNSTPAPAARPSRNLQAEISKQAQLLWRGYGQPHGRDLAIWLEAERQVLGVEPLVGAQNSGAVAAAEFAAGRASVPPPAGTPVTE